MWQAQSSADQILGDTKVRTARKLRLRNVLWQDGLQYWIEKLYTDDFQQIHENNEICILYVLSYVYINSGLASSLCEGEASHPRPADIKRSVGGKKKDITVHMLTDMIGEHLKKFLNSFDLSVVNLCESYMLAIVHPHCNYGWRLHPCTAYIYYKKVVVKHDGQFNFSLALATHISPTTSVFNHIPMLFNSQMP